MSECLTVWYVRVVLCHACDLVRVMRVQMAIHYAAFSGAMSALMMLLGWGAAIDSVDAARNTPLHYAIAQENYEMVQFLLYHHANVNHKNLEGKTPLHFALEIGYQLFTHIP